ncbi:MULTISPECIES: aminoglycoside phosphotransferase family protein [unclassified Novosphingobium]|uniref:aminoglycoside phosphotransferase family protein n=1 Tax=unclassified Novosphingobium TaxID=2644732 RepID=UPI00086A26E9|nr:MULTISPECIES: phosphotransferase [unclassified Novosphingobium]MBN9145629.1 phosphotransferase [Novosphingobium sp.]MDR6709504.1 aminoglycoside/choline kinase family phosphotransferase [Novosphingobium sp. 1748]ODU80761.1 MAG: aminoglycoside phosphotransferase [Novosphingobium sp. SCN 63-17]OJX87910.1 MAG: aminoglycoside phosphotransferase [Novosphingobium sp. 63-713]
MLNNLPDGLTEFAALAGWGDAAVEPLPGDASFRRYFRLRRETGEVAMLMHAPPPQEDPAPFLAVAGWLGDHGLRAPAILAQQAERGWVLLEDFGNDRVRDWLDKRPQDERAVYEGALAPLVALTRLPGGPWAPYDWAVYRREVRLLTEWYTPAMGLSVDEAAYDAAWEEALAPMIARQNAYNATGGVTVLRDYHAENIMLLPGGLADQGLLDFQDALVGHPAYDLVSLLQDARRDVSPAIEAAMIEHYLAATGFDREAFLADYALLGAQRNAKIVGIFVRLCRRDGKPRYLDMIPRVWAAMERDLAHPALAPVVRWFADNIPAEIRAAHGGRIAA